MKAAVGVLKRIQRRLSPTDREFRTLWPRIDAIEGFLVSPAQERWLFGAARSLRSGAVIVEIGSFKGRSTSCLAYGCRGSRKHVFAIDTFEGNTKDFTPGTLFERPFYQEFVRNIEANGLSQYVTPLSGQSVDIAKAWTRPIDLLFIDGGHEYEDVLSDFESFFPHVVDGGMVAFHDCHNFATDPHAQVGFPGVLRVWNENATPVLSDRGMCATLAYGRKRAG